MGHHVRIAVPLPFCYSPVDKVIHNCRSQEIGPGLCLALVYVYPLTSSPAVQEGAYKGYYAKWRSNRICVRYRIPTRQSVRPAGYVRKTDQGTVMVSPSSIGWERPSSSQWATTEIDDIVLYLSNILIIKPPFFHWPGSHIFHKHVWPLNQPPGYILPQWSAYVQADTVFAVIVKGKLDTAVNAWDHIFVWNNEPDRIRMSMTLYFNHGGSLLGHEPHSQRSSDRCGKICHLESFKNRFSHLNYPLRFE